MTTNVNVRNSFVNGSMARVRIPLCRYERCVHDMCVVSLCWSINTLSTLTFMSMCEYISLKLARRWTRTFTWNRFEQRPRMTAPASAGDTLGAMDVIQIRRRTKGIRQRTGLFEIPTFTFPAQLHVCVFNCRYLHFTIGKWGLAKQQLNTSERVRTYFEPYFEFVSTELAQGNNVLVHSGISWLMKYCDMDAQTAITVAKRARHAINPIGPFSILLSKIEAALAEGKAV